MKRITCAALWLGLVACSGAPPAEETAQTTQLQQAGKGIEAAEMAEHMLALRAAAVLGDQPEVERRMAAMNEQMRLAMRIPDPARPVNREAARAQVLALEGGAVWYGSIRTICWSG
ncbi:hypothetical protein CO611_07420 [Lysobacteraceae bacterium NML03-0222]|nr:hypothetical protein CO611_07420 [Xanthomonadaceae bacterium NML03-0222]